MAMTIETARKLLDTKQGSALDEIFADEEDGGLSKSDVLSLKKDYGIHFTGKETRSRLLSAFQDHFGVETPAERRERIAQQAATRGLVKNKYAGRCSATGKQVTAGDGFARKTDDGWVVYSADAVESGADKESVLAGYSDETLLAEVRRRGLSL